MTLAEALREIRRLCSKKPGCGDYEIGEIARAALAAHEREPRTSVLTERLDWLCERMEIANRSLNLYRHGHDKLHGYYTKAETKAYLTGKGGE